MKVGDGASTYESLSYINPDVEIYTDNGIVPPDEYYIGSEDQRVSNTYTSTLHVTYIVNDIADQGGNISVNCDLIPSRDYCSLGIMAAKWNDIYVNTIYCSSIRPSYGSPDLELEESDYHIRVKNVADPQTSTDAANKDYVDIQMQNILLKMYPIGSIYMSVVNTNPSEYFGGTWVAWGSGRVPVGVDASDTDFNAVEKSAGYKTYYYQHSHRVNSHTHTVSHTHTINSHTHTTANHTLTVDEMPSHTHTLNNASFKIQWDGIFREEPSNGTNYRSGSTAPTITMDASGGDLPHNHGNTGGTSLTTNTSSISDTGAASPMVTLESTYINVLQPYITCYMWKRTA